MKILFINNSLINDGGVETFLINLANFLKRKYLVEILVLNNKIEYDYGEFDKIKIHFTDKKYRAKKAKNFFKFLEYKYFYYKKLSRFITNINADIIVVLKDIQIELISELRRYYKINSKIIGSLHNNYRLHWNIKGFLKEKYQNIDYLTVLTQSDKEFYEKYVEKPTFIMPNPLILPKLILNKENIVLLVSRISEDKRVDLFIKAAAICQKKIHNYRFIVIGSGNKLQSMRDLSDKLGADIEFLGQLSREKTYEYFAKSKIFVLSSELESWGLVLQEAAFYKCARISTKFKGDSLELLIKHNVDGLVCELNEKSMSKCIMQLIENSFLCAKIIKETNFNNNNVSFKKWDNFFQTL